MSHRPQPKPRMAKPVFKYTSYDVTDADVLYEDNHLIAINKRAGDIVQVDDTGDESLEDKVKKYIANVILKCIVHYIVQIGILAQKSGFKALVYAQHIVYHQYLTITMLAGANANGGDIQHFAYFFGEFSRYFFKYDGKAAQFL